MNSQISVSKITIAAFCQEHGIKRLAIFGSALRKDFGPESDIDVLVEFEPDRIPGLLGIAGMELELSELFTGRKVDLRTPEDLRSCFKITGEFPSASEKVAVKAGKPAHICLYGWA